MYEDPEPKKWFWWLLGGLAVVIVVVYLNETGRISIQLLDKLLEKI
jgi:hypothetical protein